MAYDIPSYGTSGYKNPLGKNTPSWGGESSQGDYGNLPGYKNPLGKETPSWSGGGIDWGKGNNIDWGGGSPPFGVADRNDPILGSREREKPSWLDKATKAVDQSTAFKQQREREEGGRFGSPIGGSAGQVLENLGVVFPQQHAPVVIPGQEGKKGVGGALGTIAGIGLSFIPGIGPGLAAALPALGGASGSLFD